MVFDLRKALMMLLMVGLLLSAVVCAVFARQYVWSDTFSEFEPYFYVDDYSSDAWCEVVNSTTSNVTFTHSNVDGVLQICANTVNDTDAESLVFYREVNIESSLTFECRFSANVPSTFTIDLLYVEGGSWAGFAFSVVMHSSQAIYLKYVNVSGAISEILVSATIDADAWYTAEIKWDASPNHLHVLFYKEGVDTAISNTTITDNLYDFTDVCGVAMSVGSYPTVNFFRAYVDYIRVGGGLGSSMFSAELMGAIVSIVMLGTCFAIIKKLGR